jgi:hypothetical protein
LTMVATIHFPIPGPMRMPETAMVGPNGEPMGPMSTDGG